MDAGFWIKKWEELDIAFHENEANPLLVKHFKELSLPPGSRLFIPLCGKTLDISWLLSKGYSVAGAELSEKAIGQLFADLEVVPKISKIGELKHYSAKNIDIYVGDIFNLTRSILGPVDGIYDRAALVALPEDTRRRYAKHLIELTDKSPQLLICFLYDQSLLDGPPFSITNEEVERHYGDKYDLNLIESKDVSGGLKGKCAAMENVWLLR
ncbi:MAG: thiopurine S-methyltransferase [Emcibacter sp.]|nr:thiopurine S-methyltransferase [Emcibacter sp.]